MAGQQVEILVDDGAIVGENPLWDPVRQELAWIDIEGRRVHWYNPTTGAASSMDLPDRPGSIARTTDPHTLLMSMEHQVCWFDIDSGGITPWIDLEPGGTRNRLNDGSTDRQGRFWVGSMDGEPAARNFTGRLHRLGPDGSVATVRDGLGISNGTAFSLDGRTFFHADTFAGVVWRHDYDPDTGAATNREVFVDFSDLPGLPDGACVDADDHYWVAGVFGSRLYRFDPAGRLEREVILPVACPTMPAFGGSSLDTLFVTSLSETAPPGDTHAGALMAVDVGVTGVVDAAFPID